LLAHCPKTNTRFQSFFVLITTQPCDFALSQSAWLKVPTSLSGILSLRDKGGRPGLPIEIVL
jgi:hypothetical protein